MIGLLLRCYPARWRDRYGDEFEALLQERTLGPFDVADVLLAALDARLHLRGRDPALDHGRGFPMTLRIGGFAAIVSGVLWFIFFAANAINNGADTISAWLGLLALAATLVTLVALIGLSAFEARREPLLAWAAFALPAGSAVVSLVGWIGMAANGDSDRPIVGDLSAWALMSFGLIGLLAGSGLFALAALRTRNLSRPAAALLASARCSSSRHSPARPRVSGRRPSRRSSSSSPLSRSPQAGPPWASAPFASVVPPPVRWGEPPCSGGVPAAGHSPPAAVRNRPQALCAAPSRM